MEVFTLEAHDIGDFLSVAPSGEPFLRKGVQREQELFALEAFGDGIVALVAVGSAACGRYFFLSHASGELRFDDRFQGSLWILHNAADGKVDFASGGKIAFECSGVEKGKYLSWNGEEVCLQSGLQGEGAWWLLKPFFRIYNNPISLCFGGQYLSHVKGEVSTQRAVGGGEAFWLEQLSNGRVALACSGGYEEGKYLSHDHFRLGLTSTRGEGEEWICHEHGNGVVAFEACGRESGKFLGIDYAEVRLANSFRDNGHLWQLKQV
jgi:hypothetical protein